MKKILSVLLVIAISLFSILTATEIVSFNLGLYSKSFVEHNIEEVSGKSMEELDQIAEDLTLYLDDKASEEILQPNFNEREILHMVDVKELFRLGKIIRNISLVIIIGLGSYFFVKRERKVGKFVFWGLFANYFLLILLGMMIYLDFSKYFTLFHHIFFSNDLWLLNPKTDLLIQILPEQFFMSMATRIVLYFLILLALFQGFLYLVGKRDEKKLKEKI